MLLDIIVVENLFSLLQFQSSDTSTSEYEERLRNSI